MKYNEMERKQLHAEWHNSNVSYSNQYKLYAIKIYQTLLKKYASGVDTDEALRGV